MDAEFRLGAFVLVFCMMAIWECLNPRRKVDPQRKRRWIVNLGLMILGAILVRVTVGGIVYESALIAESKNIGLLNHLHLPTFLAATVSIVLLDLVIYGQHVLSHKMPLLWTLHQVHHTDLVYDATTGVRFHPLEIFFSVCVKVIAIFSIGANPIAVIIFEVLLNISAVFNHSNIKIPLAWDKQIRKVIVTPDMHRVHHSVYQKETDSNYGFSISIWDRLFKTYTDQPRDGHTEMKIGLQYARDEKDNQFKNVLLMPFRKFY